MSTTHPESRQSDQDDSDELAPEAAYEKLVEQNDAICSRCFRRLYTRVEALVPVDIAERRDTEYVVAEEAEIGDEFHVCERNQPTENSETCYPPRARNPSADADYDVDDLDMTDRRATPPEVGFCLGCGAIDDDADRPTLSKGDAKDMALRLARRLVEQDTDLDPRRLVALVGKWKSDPQLAGRDDAIFAGATHAAIVYHRTGRTPAEARPDSE